MQSAHVVIKKSAMPLGGVFVLYSAFFQYCSTVHVPQDIKTTSETQTWEKNHPFWQQRLMKRKICWFFFLTEALKATDLPSFQRKNHMLSFFRLTSVKCCRLTSYTSTQKSLTPSAEFQSERKIHWKKKICNGSWIPAYRLVKCQRCSQERITAHTTLNLLFVSDFILLSSGQVHACMSGGNWAGVCPRRSWIMPSFFENHRAQILNKKKRSPLQIQLPFKKR